jgi:hypothetical protein
MTPDESTPLTLEPEAAPRATPEPEFRTIGPKLAAKVAGDEVQANLSVIGTVSAGTLSATGSVVGIAAVDGDATVTASMIPAVLTRGDMTVQQSYASAIIVGGGGDTKVHQAAAPLIVGRTMDLSQAGGALLVAGEADVKGSWVGVVLAPKATISEDSRVFISTRAAIIIAAALFGGFALVALVMALGVRRAMRWRPTLSLPQLPSLHEVHLPDLAAIQERLHHLRRSA